MTWQTIVLNKVRHAMLAHRRASLVTAGVLTLPWIVLWALSSQWSYVVMSTDGTMWGFGRGQAGWSWRDPSRDKSRDPSIPHELTIVRPTRDDMTLEAYAISGGLYKLRYRFFSTFRMALGSTTPFVALVVFYQWSDRRRPGQCRWCKCDRSGLATDSVCPECGRK